MRTRCFVRTFCKIAAALAVCALLAPQAGAQGGPAGGQDWKAVTLPSGRTVRLSSGPETTTLTLSQAQGAPVSVELDRDQDVAPSAPLLDLAAVAEVEGRAFIITDGYPSVPSGLSYCRAGEEQFLRVLAVSGQLLRQTLRLKLASCRNNVELASDGLQWAPDSTTLSVHWLFAPGTDQQPATQEYKIDLSGTPTLLPKQ